MPTFSYKGYDFEVAHQPTAEEFAQMSAYVDTLPPKETKAKLNPDELFHELSQKGKNWTAGLQGAAETGLSLATGAAAMPGGAIASGLSQLTQNPFGVEQGMEALTYEPRTELGKEFTNKAGEAISRYVVPAAVAVQGLPYANTLAPAAEALAGSLKRAGKATPKAVAKEPVKGLSTALDELSGKTPEVVDPMAEFYKQQAQEKQQQAIAQQQRAGEQPITVDTQGRASTLGATGPLEPVSPMESMARQLGAEPASPEATPMSRMASDLTAERSTPEQRAVQERIDARNAAQEAELRQQMALDINAERYRNRENAPTGYAEHVQGEEQRAHDLRVQRDSEMAQRAGQGEQANLWEPHTNMARPYTEVFAQEQGKVRPFSFNEFKTTLDNLAKEPGTAFKMPEDLKAAYHEYLAHPEHGQQDLFGAHTVEQKPSHVPYGELSPQKRGAMTKQAKNGKTISDAMLERMRIEELSGKDGITKMNAMMPDDFLKKFPGFSASKLRDPSGQLRVMYHGTSKDKIFQEVKAGNRGAWLTGDPTSASEYAKQNDSQKLVYENGRYNEVNTASRVMPVYVNLKNPYTLSASDTAAYRTAKSYAKFQKDLTDRVKREGYDGIDWGYDVYTVFDGSQIKSAIAPETKTPKIIEMRSGFTAEDMHLSQLLHKFGGPSPMNNIPGIGDRLKSIGNARIETPELAIKLAKEVPDVSQNAAQRAINYLTKGGIYLKAKLNNPVVHFTVDRFIKAEGLAKAEISQKLHGEYLTTLRDLSKQEYKTAFELLNVADLYKKELTPEFLTEHTISPKVQEFIQLHQSMMKKALDKINQVREAAGKKPIQARVAYSAMNMTGDFRKVVRKDGEVVGVIGANSKTIGKNSLSKLETSLKQKDPTLEFGPLQDMSAVNRSNKGTPHEAFLDALNILGEDNPNIAQFLDTLKEVAKDDPNNYMGMQKHTMQKKGVFGMEGRKPWMTTEENATAFFENQVKYLESSFNWSELALAAKDVNQVLRDGDVVGKQSNAITLSERYMQNALGLNPSKIGNAFTNFMNTAFSSAGIGPSIPKQGMELARSGANTMLLSLNPAFLGIQLIQSPAVLPGITAMLRGLGAAPKGTALTFGFNHAANAMVALGKYVTGKGSLSAIERGALDYATKNHIYATDLVEHTNQTQKGVAYYTSKITQTPAAKIEAGTRAHMFMTLVDMMHEAGVKPKDGLYEQAQRFTDMAMNHYGSIEKPQMYNALGPLGSMAYNLRSFGHNEISRWALYARELSQTGNKAPLLTQMASTIALAGVMGLPLFSEWEFIYDFITKKLGKPRSLALDVMTASEKVGQALGPNGAYALSNGLPSLLGTDLSKRTGLGDVLPSSAADAAFAGGLKLGQMAKAGYQLATNPSEETAKAAAINFAPPIAQGPLDLAWYQKGNLAYSKDPENLRPMAQRNDADVLFKKIGLMGINESAQKQKDYQQTQLDKAYQEYRTTAMHTIAQDFFRNRPIEQKTIDRYFATGQGDPSTFMRDLEQLAVQQNMSPEQFALLRQSATQQIPQLQSLIRRTQ